MFPQVHLEHDLNRHKTCSTYIFLWRTYNFVLALIDCQAVGVRSHYYYMLRIDRAEIT